MRLQQVMLGAGLALVMFGCSKPVAGPATSSSSRNAPNDSTSHDASSADSKTETPTAKADSGSQPAEEPGTPIPGPKGRIAGVVKFAGEEIPQSTIVPNGTDPQICGAEMSKRDYVISAENRGIRFVLVWLEQVELPEGYQPPRQTLVLDNSKCMFEPHAAVITVGSTIETRNSDEVYHTTNLKGRATSENIPLTTKGTSHRTKTRAAELIGVSCDKHGWMQAFIRVDPHPFHAVTDADGKFTIADVPAGTYKLKLFHEKFYGQDVDVTVKEDEITNLELKYPAD